MHVQAARDRLVEIGDDEVPRSPTAKHAYVEVWVSREPILHLLLTGRALHQMFPASFPAY